jgi:hypothetical protein
MVSVQDVSKHDLLYDRPQDRLKQTLSAHRVGGFFALPVGGFLGR